MPEAPGPQFGELPPGQEAVDRPGAYGVAFGGAGADRVLLVRWRGRYFLPGGGVLGGESPLEALERELLEETGHAVRSAEPLGEAGQYVLDTATGRHLNKRCAFYAVRLGARVREPAQWDHGVAWVPAGEAARLLHEEASAWAVGLAR